MVYKGYYLTGSLLKEAYLNETFQGIQTRRCSKEKPEPKTFRTAVEKKQAGTRGDPKITEAIYDASVSSYSQSFATASVKIQLQKRFNFRHQFNFEAPSGSQWLTIVVHMSKKILKTKWCPSTLIPEPEHLFLHQVVFCNKS
jgi:hypothetical protein